MDSLSREFNGNLKIRDGVYIPKAGRLARGNTITIATQDNHLVRVRVDDLLMGLSRVDPQGVNREQLKILNKGFSNMIKEARAQNPQKSKAVVIADLVQRISQSMPKNSLGEGLSDVAASLEKVYNLQKQQNKVLRGEVYQIDGEKMAMESSTRIDTIARLERAYRDEFQYFAAIRTSNPKRRKEITRRLELLEDQLLPKAEAAKERGLTWITSEQYRDDTRRGDKGLGKGKADELYVPALVNARTHQLQTRSEDFTFQRMGAITDPRDGTKNLAACSGERYAQRQRCLQDQMLQLLTMHMESRIDQLKDPLSPENRTGTLVIGQVSLLNPKCKGQKAKKYGTFVQDERNQMMDMATIFEQFEGKTLIFDGKGPFIDEHGRVHLPKKILDPVDGSPKELTLKTLFFNVAVERSSRNQDDQGRINEAGLQKLESLIRRQGDQARINQLRRALAGGKSNDEIAQSIAQLMMDVGACVGINCFSGKDRTGRIGVRMILGALKRTVDGLGLGLKRAQAVMKAFGKQAWSKMGVSMQIVRQNTQLLAIKVEKLAFWKIHGMSKRQVLENAATVIIGKAEA